MMNDLPRQQLKLIIDRYGRSISEDPKRCEALLRDLCGQYRKEISVLVSAVRESVPVDLDNSQHRIPSDLLLAQLAKRLEDRLAIDPAAARWSVESWALALGLISESDCQQEKEPVNNPPPPPNPPRTEQTNNPPPPPNPPRTEQTNNPPPPPNPPRTDRTNNPPPPPNPPRTDRTNNPPPSNPPSAKKADIKLFTQNQVRWATLFGGLVAGSMLMALNYRSTGQRAKAREFFIIGLIPNLLVDILMIIYSPYIAGQFLGFILLPSIYVAHKWYEKSQNTLFKQHLLNGGKTASWWRVLLTVFLAILLIAPLLNLPTLVVAIIAGGKF